MIRAALVLFLCASACAYEITGYPEQPALTAGPTVNDVAVHVTWERDIDAIARKCTPEPDKIIYACARWNLQLHTCDIHAIQPKNFNDEAKLAVLGHELMHCLGAEHGR